MGHKNKYKFALLKYLIASGWREPKYRVAPCIDAMISEIETVRKCCEAIILEVHKDSPEGEALSGAVSILASIKSELYEASSVLRHELKNGRS